MFKLLGVPSPAIAIDAAAKIALHYSGISKACSAIYTLLSAGYYGQQMAEAGGYVYWMTQQWDTRAHIWLPTVTHVIVRVGMNPGDGVHFYETEFKADIDHSFLANWQLRPLAAGRLRARGQRVCGCRAAGDTSGTSKGCGRCRRPRLCPGAREHRHRPGSRRDGPAAAAGVPPAPQPGAGR
jgi:hypothetical protein